MGTAQLPDLQLKRLRHTYDLSTCQYSQISSTIPLEMEEKSKEIYRESWWDIGIRGKVDAKGREQGFGKRKICDKNPIFSTSFGSVTYMC